MTTQREAESKAEPGSVRDAETRVLPLAGPDGRETEPYSRLLFERLPVGLVLCRMNGELVDVNPTYAQMIGRTVTETLRLTYWDITPEHYAADEQRQLESLERTGRYGPYEKEYIHKDGRLIPVRLSGRTLEHQGERYIWSWVEDITERRAVEAQRLEHLRYLDAMERVNRAIRRAPDLESLMGDVLQEMLAIFGCDRAWLSYPCDPESPSFRIMREADTPAWPGAVAVAAGDIPMNEDAARMFALALASEDPIRCDPATGLPIEPTARQFAVQSQMLMALHPKTGAPWIFGMHHCETPHVWTAEEARIFRETARRMSDALSGALYLRDLRESEERQRTLVEHAPEAILVLDSDTGLFVQANSKATALFKLTTSDLRAVGPVDLCEASQPGGRRATEVVAEATVRALTGEPLVLQWDCRDADGRPIACEVRMVRLPASDRRLIRISLTDMTERRQLEEQLRQAVKMQAIGTLAGGIAHDFNNLLVVILGGGEMLANVLGPAHPLAGSAREVVQAARRAAELTHQLLAFSRKQVMKPQVINLNEVVGEVSRLVARLIGEDVELQTRLAPNGVLARADRGQVWQVVVNLCTNARDAMPRGGTLCIETGYCAFGPDDPGRPTELPPGRYAKVEVADTGTGIPTAILARVFEPFFTTKEVGKGTGLGLSTVYGIVKQSDGDVVVRSEPGRGARFSVYLPAADEKAPELAAGSPAPEGLSSEGMATILVVEDNAAVAGMLAQTLRQAGYEVIEARDGEHALETIGRRGIDRIDLLLTDLVMPRMSGTELATRLRDESADLKVLCMSGYDDGGVAGRQFAFLQKPFSPTELIQRVREVLDGRAH